MAASSPPQKKETNMECQKSPQNELENIIMFIFLFGLKSFISGFNIGRFCKGCIPYDFEDSLGSWFLPRFPHLDAGDDV